MLWIALTIVAAFLQNLRSALQKAIKGRLTTAGAAYARFVYAWPFALVYLLALDRFGGFAAPAPDLVFLIWCAAGGLCQILFTVVLLRIFSYRSFAVGTTFSKLEVPLIALLGWMVLGDAVGPYAGVAIAVGAAGAVALSLTGARLSLAGLVRDMGSRTTAMGLLSALLLGASVVCFRGAALALESPGAEPGGADFVMRASFTLAVSLLMQTLMMGAWFLACDRGQLVRVAAEWRRALPVGLAGMACSACWFTAFAIQNAAYVRALGQVELVFTFLAGGLVFHERTRPSEAVGVALIVASVLILLLTA